MNDAFDPAVAPRAVNSMPFAGFFSTPVDLARFVQMLLDGGSIGGRTLLREEIVAGMFDEHVVGQGIHQALTWFLSFPSGSGRDDGGPCGFWHTSSSGSLIAANLATRCAVIVLGQGLLPDDLVPLRSVEWKYARSATGTWPLRPKVSSPSDAYAWVRALDVPTPQQR